MQSVSRDWLDTNKEPIIKECFVEVELEIADTEALYTATADATPELEILSDVTDILKNTKFKKYGTLEHNFWILDGSIAWADEIQNEPAGYISNSISDDNYTFSTVPIINITPEEVQSNIYGITITFSELFKEYATEFEVIFWLNNEIASSQIITGNSLVVCPIQAETGEFDKLEVRIYKWCLPGRRARVENILMGYKRKFDKNELIDFQIAKSVSPASAVLPEDTLEFSIDRTKVDYELNSDDTLSKYFRQRQKVTAKLGLRTSTGAEEYISGGTYYLKEWDFGRGSIKGGFTAKGLMSFLNKPYTKGVYSPTGKSLYALALDVLNDALENSGFTFTWLISRHLIELTTTAPLPVCTWAECLQLIANAGGCMLNVTRDGQIRMLTTTYTGTEQKYTITNDVLFDYPKVELMQELKSISCDVYSNGLGETETLYNAVHLIDGDTEITIQYDTSGDITYSVTPYQSAEITVESVDLYANNSVFKISGSGYAIIKLEGKKLSTSSSIYMINVSDNGNEERIQNPLITNIKTAKKACETTVSWFQNRSQETFSEFRADPRLDAGDFVSYMDEDVLISDVKYDFTGMFRGNCTGRIGYSPFVAPESDEIPDINSQLFPDINGDGMADAVDASIINQAAANISMGLPSGLTPEQEVLADANRDGSIDVLDTSLILRFSAQVGIGKYSQSPNEWERFLKNEGVI